VTSEAWNAQTIEGTKDFDDIDCIGDAEKKPETCLSSFNIVSHQENQNFLKRLNSLDPP
jgi:hypothetical protein